MFDSVSYPSFRVNARKDPPVASHMERENYVDCLTSKKQDSVYHSETDNALNLQINANMPTDKAS
jgi:hypothetical protein